MVNETTNNVPCPECGADLEIDTQAETERTDFVPNLGAVVVTVPARVAFCPCCEFAHQF